MRRVPDDGPQWESKTLVYLNLDYTYQQVEATNMKKKKKKRGLDTQQAIKKK